MSKNKCGIVKNKKKKVPFNVLSKKGLMAIAISGVMAFSPLMLAGCSNGQDGKNGTNGSSWYSGTEYSPTQGVVGDFFYDTDDFNIYTKTEDGWTLISNIKGPQGEEGEKGQDGVTPTITINEDGYWVINGVPTDVKAEAINGTDGKDGNTWIVGTEYPTKPNSGDMFLNNNTWDIYQYNGTEWVLKGNIKGKDGNGGQNDAVIYIGYDGCIWNGTEKTEFSINANLAENVVENTIGIEGETMSRYFEGSYMDLSENTIALMANYMPNAKLTQYGATKVSQIKVVAKESGELHIGTAKVEDVVNARLNGVSYTVNSTAYEVVAGLNTISLDLEVLGDETIVLGGQGSVGLYYAKGITVDDEHGNFTFMNGASHSEVISETNNITDTLAVQVVAETTRKIIDSENVHHAVGTSNDFDVDVVEWSPANQSNGPWMYSTNIKAYENKAISSIRIPVVSVKSITEKPVFTLRVTSYREGNTNHVFTKNDIRQTIKLEVPLDEISHGVYDDTSEEGKTSTRGEYVVNKWIEFDLSKLNITVREGETLVFGDSSDTVHLAYSKEDKGILNFYTVRPIPESGTTNTSNSVAMSFLADVVVSDYIEALNFADHLEMIRQIENSANEKNVLKQLQDILNGKNFSLLGDSISTYNGYCNNTETNSTLGNNVFRYDDADKANRPTVPFTSVNETWWMQTANETGMNLLVNNSWAGSEAFGDREGSNHVMIDGAWKDRCVQLHDDVGENAGTNPDVIAVYLGINDYNFNREYVGTGEIDFDSLIIDNEDGTFSYGTPEEFKDGYAIMIHKMLTKYEDAQIFIFTVLPAYMYTIDVDSWNLHNKYIRDVANHFNLPLVDLAENSGITWSNMRDYLHTDKIHPNEAGMDLITKCFMKALQEHYLSDK